MKIDSPTKEEGFYPGAFDVPPLFRSPPQPLAMLKWFLFRFMWYQSLLWIGISALCYHFFTPQLTDFRNFDFESLVFLWLRNVLVMLLIVGFQHWYLYCYRGQGRTYKYDTRWMATNKRSFTFKNQTKDNMFWSLISGCGIAALYEAFMFYLYANEKIPTTSSLPLTVLTTVALFWITGVHFYANHRLLHVKPLYDFAHSLHHRNVNTGPWSGISMHPLEHVLYFSLPLIFLVFPASPFLTTFSMIYLILAPSPSHSGFHRYKFGKKEVDAADYFHYLHHRYFDCNYGMLLLPIDKWLGTFHSGSEEDHKKIIEKRLEKPEESQR